MSRELGSGAAATGMSDTLVRVTDDPRSLRLESGTPGTMGWFRLVSALSTGSVIDDSYSSSRTTFSGCFSQSHCWTGLIVTPNWSMPGSPCSCHQS